MAPVKLDQGQQAQVVFQALQKDGFVKKDADLFLLGVGLDLKYGKLRVRGRGGARLGRPAFLGISRASPKSQAQGAKRR
jgi:hypothetical protein